MEGRWRGGGGEVEVEGRWRGGGEVHIAYEIHRAGNNSLCRTEKQAQQWPVQRWTRMPLPLGRGFGCRLVGGGLAGENSRQRLVVDEGADGRGASGARAGGCREESFVPVFCVSAGRSLSIDFLRCFVCE